MTDIRAVVVYSTCTVYEGEPPDRERQRERAAERGAGPGQKTCCGRK